MPEAKYIRQQQKRYWQKTLGLTGALLIIWFLVTFIVPYYSVWLNEWMFLGFPLGYFLVAKGSLFIYIVLIAVYALLMNRLDRQFGVDEQ